MKDRNRSVTLLELLIAIVLLSVIVLALTTIDFFSRNNVVNADVIAGLQNKGFLALEHMRKNLIPAIGNDYLYGPRSVVDREDPITGVEAGRLKVFLDINGNAGRDAGDHWTAYMWYAGVPAARADWFQLQYCSNCANKNCGGGNCTTGWTVLTSNVINFVPLIAEDAGNNLTQNTVDVEITTCLHPDWNFDANPDCGTSRDNPQVTMRTRILMPGVSVR